MAAKMTVGVQFSSFCRKFEFEVPPGGDKTKREVLEEQIPVRASFREKINIEDSITLQVLDKDWDGLFFGFFDDTVPDRSVFRIIVEDKNQVCPSNGSGIAASFVGLLFIDYQICCSSYNS